MDDTKVRMRMFYATPKCQQCKGQGMNVQGGCPTCHGTTHAQADAACELCKGEGIQIGCNRCGGYVPAPLAARMTGGSRSPISQGPRAHSSPPPAPPAGQPRPDPFGRGPGAQPQQSLQPAPPAGIPEARIPTSPGHHRSGGGSMNWLAAMVGAGMGLVFIGLAFAAWNYWVSKGMRSADIKHEPHSPTPGSDGSGAPSASAPPSVTPAPSASASAAIPNTCGDGQLLDPQTGRCVCPSDICKKKRAAAPKAAPVAPTPKAAPPPSAEQPPEEVVFRAPRQCGPDGRGFCDPDRRP